MICWMLLSTLRSGDDSQPTPLPGLYQADYKQTMHIHDMKRHVTITHNVTIQPGSSQKILVSTDKFAPKLQKGNFVYFKNAQNIEALNGAEILLHSGNYPRVNRTISITASNFSDEPREIKCGLKVGTIREVSELGEDPAINFLKSGERSVPCRN